MTWTPKVCRIIAFCRLWAIILPTFGGLGAVFIISGTTIERSLDAQCSQDLWLQDASGFGGFMAVGLQCFCLRMLGFKISGLGFEVWFVFRMWA